MKILRINIISFHIIIACILFNTNCGSDSIIPGMPAAYTQTVGAAGATVTDPRGGQVIIPAEALASDIVISITTYSATDMKRYYGIGSFTSCIDLGPDGTSPWGNQAGIDNSARIIWSETPFNTDDHYWSIRLTPVPEPATMSVLALAAVAAIRRRTPSK